MCRAIFTSREMIVVGFLAASLLAGSGAYVYVNSSREEPAPVQSFTVIPPAPPEPEAPVRIDTPVVAIADGPKVTVAVAGAVRRPGVYKLAGDSRVADLIVRAGGEQEAADLADINLAAKLIDGTTLTIPESQQPGTFRRQLPVPNPPQYTISGWRAPTGDASAAVVSGRTAGGRINLNTATLAELETLPGIGPVLAQAILDYRGANGFRTIQDLQEVRGIGPKRFEAIQHLVTLD